MKRVANIALNVLLICTCALTCVDIVRSLMESKKSEAARAAMDKMTGPAVGNPLALPGEDWGKNPDGTLVFGISTGCHFCTESAPFYKRLVKSAGSSIGMIAVAPEPTEQIRIYLTGLGLAISDIRQIRLAELGIRGTPTLVFVNRAGRVVKVWKGALSSDREQEVADFMLARAGR